MRPDRDDVDMKDEDIETKTPPTSPFSPSAFIKKNYNLSPTREQKKQSP
jgi:hypothetical protein